MGANRRNLGSRSEHIAPIDHMSTDHISIDHIARVPLSPADPRSGRIPGLDGLRAVAVIAVLGFHLWPSAVPGGFLGVDVFFVISGFLITTLLLRERLRGGLTDLVGFWRRRARRLLPAIVVVVVTSIAAARLVDGNLLVGIRRQVLGAATFSTNLVELIAGGDYFDQSSPSLFLTFWSLAVEEQFYLVWPLMFVTMIALAEHANRAIHRLWRVSLALAVLSAVLMGVLFDPGSSQSRVYYGTDTHSFGLMLGVSLAFAYAGSVGLLRSPIWIRARRWVGFVALAGLGALVFVVDASSSWTYRGGIFLASVLALVIVAVMPGESTGFVRIFHASPLVWIGTRSYGIYLWHWPVLLIVEAVMPARAPGEAPNPVTILLIVSLTILLSAASFEWIEKPVISGGFRGSWRSLSSWTRTSIRGNDARNVAGNRARVLLSGTAAAVVISLATLGMVTAPHQSEAQSSVESGQALIAAQEKPEPSAVTTTTAAVAVPGPVESTVPPPAWPTELAVPPGNLMVGMGDSVMSGAAPALYERFPGIYLDAKPIRKWVDAPPVARSMIDAGTMRGVVIVNFGTNAGLINEESQGALRSILDMLGPGRRVVLVTIVGVSRWVTESNATLRAISAEYPNTIVADWHGVVQNHPGLLHDDRTHPNMRGIVAYADVISAALDELGPA